MNRSRLFLPPVAMLIIAGCTTPFGEFKGEDYMATRVPEQRLRTIGSANLEAHATSEPVTIDQAAEAHLAGWRPEQYDANNDAIELTLAEIRAAALANNLDLRVALIDPAISDTSVDEESARFEWTFTSSIRRNRLDTPTASTLSGSQLTNDDLDFGVRIPLYTGGTISVNLPMTRTETNNIFSTLNPAYTSDLRFSLSQPLLRNAGLRVNTHGIRVAQYQRQIVDARTKLEAIRVLASADRSYWRLYAALQELDVRVQQYELAERQLERAQRRVDAGADVEIEVLRAESGRAERLEAIIIAENIVRQRQRELKRIVNIPGLPINSPTRIVAATPPSPLGLELDAGSLADHAVNHRMEMLELELQLAIDASNLDLERNRALPLFTLDYVYNVNGLGRTWGDSFEMLGDKSFEDHTIGLSAEIPLGNEAAKARVHRAILQRVQRLATRDQRQLAIRQEVLDAVDQLDTTWQRILAARQSAILAGRRLQGEERQFEVGLRTSTDVLDAAAALAEAQLAEIRALVDYQIAMIDIAFATGTLFGQTQVEWEPYEARQTTR